MFKRLNYKFFIGVIILSLWGSVFFILPDFLIYPTSGFKGILYTLSHWALVSIPLLLLFYLLWINKYVFALIFPLVFILGSIVGFYSYFYKATLTPMILDATLNNDIKTSMDVMPKLLFMVIGLNLAISILAIVLRFRKIKSTKSLYHLSAGLLLFTFILNINSRAKTSFYQHYPLSIYYNFNEYFKLSSPQNNNRILPDTISNYTSTEDLSIVFIIGETLRADHLSLNGYYRKTNPKLEKRKNIISFDNIYSEYTYTNPSVAHIMTRADSLNKELALTETSFVPLFKNSGFYTTWIANQEAAKSYVSFMQECDTLIHVHPEKSVYMYSEWLDEDIIPHYNKINNLDFDNKLIILHTIGSHWYYNNHYTEEFKIFKPVTTSKIISQNSSESIINSYDNTVVYTDNFIDNIISTLENKNSILIYLSDHGESLGEDGNWLHAGNNNALRNPACIIWCSDEFIKRYPDKFKIMNENKNRRYRTDFLFHSILSLGEIPSRVILKEHDISNKQ